MSDTCKETSYRSQWLVPHHSLPPGFWVAKGCFSGMGTRHSHPLKTPLSRCLVTNSLGWRSGCLNIFTATFSQFCTPWLQKQFQAFFLKEYLQLSGPNRATQPRCAIRFESQTPKSLAMRKSFSLAMPKLIRLILYHRKMPEKMSAKILRCWPAMREISVFFRSSDAKCLRFGLPLPFGLQCERPRCQIASDVGRAMRATKICRHGHAEKLPEN